MVKNYRIALLLIFLGMVLSCAKQKEKQTNTDSFYTQTRSYDLYRIPLIKPHQLTTPVLETGWFFELPYGQIGSLISNSIGVNKVGVKDSIIIVQTDIIYVKYKMQKAWFIVDLKTNTENVITDVNEYNNYLNKKGLQDIKLLIPDVVYQRFLDEGNLPFNVESKSISN